MPIYLGYNPPPKQKKEKKADATFKEDEEDMKPAAEGVDVCSICQETVEFGQRDATSLLHCPHGETHHEGCIHLLESNNLKTICPLCRYPLKKTRKEEEDKARLEDAVNETSKKLKEASENLKKNEDEYKELTHKRPLHEWEMFLEDAEVKTEDDRTPGPWEAYMEAESFQAYMNSFRAVDDAQVKEDKAKHDLRWFPINQRRRFKALQKRVKKATEAELNK